MSDAQLHYDAYKEGIVRATLIRKDLGHTLSEYEPQKVRDLNKAYLETVREIIRQGDLFLDKSSDLERGLKVAITITNYTALLSTLNEELY